jgi:hypothetical protein
MAQAKSNSLSKARETLVAQREKIVNGLATKKYSSKSVADLISIFGAIAILDEMIRREGHKPAAGVDIGMPVSTKG